MFGVQLDPVARAEYDDAIDWYERRRRGLGDKFERRVEKALARIVQNPKVRALVFRDVRRMPVAHSEYGVYYQIRGNVIRVLSVFHAKRDPRIWQGRV